MILVFEDRGIITYYLKKLLDIKGYDYQIAYSVRDADSLWNEYGLKIGGIILDLNIPSIGLSDDEKNKTYGGLLTGWVWLKTRVLAKDTEMKNRVIIYTEYVDKLKEYVDEKSLAGIRIISKSNADTETSGEQVLIELKKIKEMK